MSLTLRLRCFEPGAAIKGAESLIIAGSSFATHRSALPELRRRDVESNVPDLDLYKMSAAKFLAFCVAPMGWSWAVLSGLGNVWAKSVIFRWFDIDLAD